MTLDLQEIRDGDRSNDLRSLVTPEGIEIEVRLASRVERLMAVGIDVLIQWAFYLAFFLLIVLVSLMTYGSGLLEAAVLILLVGAVFLNFFYFLALEVWMGGRTPGKRVFGLRVVGADGRPLKLSGLVVRNFMRQVELFLPLSVLFSGGMGGGGYWSLLSLWILGLACYICFDADRRRFGDLLGGTIVIREPKPVLLEDIASANEDQGPLFRFTPQQLETYGRFELQVLEGILRESGRPDRAQVLDRVVKRICQKIDYGTAPPAGQHQTFLSDFYAAQRLHLEREALYGKRKETKDDDASS